VMSIGLVVVANPGRIFQFARVPSIASPSSIPTVLAAAPPHADRARYC
jgi:hypothetical protein